MAEGLEAALRRVSRLEDEGQEALLRADLAQVRGRRLQTTLLHLPACVVWLCESAC